MRAGIMTLLLVGTALSVAACQKNQANDSITITDNIPANADIEALPPDESSGTPSDQLANGEDNADVSDLNASDNSY
jgi:hypothetical protein